MKKSIRLLSIVLAFMLAFTSLTTLAAGTDFRDVYEDGEEERVIDNVVYQKFNTEYREIASERGYKGAYYAVENFCSSLEDSVKRTEINILDEIDGVPVKIIKEQPYRIEAPTIKKINLSKNLVGIGHNAFSRFINLQGIELPNSLKYIRSGAFHGLSYIERITIPAGVKEIGASAFAECDGLRRVDVKSNDIIIRRYAFFDCKNLYSVAQSKKLKRLVIGYGAFEGCIRLTSFDFPDDLRISGHAFYGSGLTSVSLPASVRMSGSTGCFAFCKNLKKVVFRNGKAKLEIPKGAFKGCTALETVVLPKSAKFVDICEHVFYDCKSLKTVENSGKIIEIGAGAFKNCKSLESIKFSSLIRVISKKTFQGCSKLKSVTFKDTKNVPGDNYSPRTKKSTEKFELYSPFQCFLTSVLYWISRGSLCGCASS